jgi:hypothetical protein
MVQSEREEQCERLGLWPVSLALSDGQWFTLWGDGETEEDDVVLASSGRLVLYASLDELYAGVAAQVSNVAGFPIFESFLESLREGLWPMSYVAYAYPLASIPDWIREGVSSWSLIQVEDTLNSLNLVWDAARSVGNTTVADTLRPEASLGEFLEGLYDVTGLLQKEWPTEAAKQLRIPAVLARWDNDVIALAAAVEEAVDSVFTPAVRLGIPSGAAGSLGE